YNATALTRLSPRSLHDALPILTTIGLDGSGITSTPCQCALTAFESTSADSVFRLTDFSGGPVLLFDGKAATPRMLFVRAGAQFRSEERRVGKECRARWGRARGE